MESFRSVKYSNVEMEMATLIKTAKMSKIIFKISSFLISYHYYVNLYTIVFEDSHKNLLINF